MCYDGLCVVAYSFYLNQWWNLLVRRKCWCTQPPQQSRYDDQYLIPCINGVVLGFQREGQNTLNDFYNPLPNSFLMALQAHWGRIASWRRPYCFVASCIQLNRYDWFLHVSSIFVGKLYTHLDQPTIFTMERSLLTNNILRRQDCHKNNTLVL